MTEIFFYGTEPFDAYSLFHLREMRFSRHFAAVSAGRPHAFVSSEAFD